MLYYYYYFDIQIKWISRPIKQDRRFRFYKIWVDWDRETTYRLGATEAKDG